MKIEDFEIGKIYTTTTQTPTIRYKCFARSPFLGNPIFEHMDGNYAGEIFSLTPKAGGLNTWKEYHEPVVHRVKIVWIKRTDGTVYTVVTDINKTDSYIRSNYSSHKVMKIKEISYTEE